jgi:Pyruvate/2-oxoacid:ferredoxin oxidoreductase delta subunit
MALTVETRARRRAKRTKNWRILKGFGAENKKIRVKNCGKFEGTRRGKVVRI